MRLLTLFLDGVGLGPADPRYNPFTTAHTPTLDSLLAGKSLYLSTLGPHVQPYHTPWATLVGLDATLGIAGLPQSASGQAALLTGINVPQQLGYHYGPKPNPEIIPLLTSGTIFHHIKDHGYRPTFLNDYPDSYFRGIDSGLRLPGAIAMAALKAGLPLMTTADLIAGRAISADFTAQGWHQRLKIPQVPILTTQQAGQQLAAIAQEYDFAFFEYWLSDIAGHRSDLESAIHLLQDFDQVLAGLLSAWHTDRDLILITSDHGNLEDLRNRRHTRNPVPALLIGPESLRARLTTSLTDLTGILPAILQCFPQKTIEH
jgi:2,3-bisphosphoglycerate-independent phosphoglycerate mutase